MAEHISRQAFMDFGCYDLVKLLEIWFPKLGVQNDNGSIWIGSWVSVIAFEKVWLRPERETNVSQMLDQMLFSWLLALVVFNYLSGAVFSSAAKASASHVFSPWTLKNAEQPVGGGSLDAI